MKRKNNNILVYYIGISGIEENKISDFMLKVANNLQLKTFDGEIIYIPINSCDSKIEMINPKYITEIELINKHNLMMKALNDNINNQIYQIKNEKEN